MKKENETEAEKQARRPKRCSAFDAGRNAKSETCKHVGKEARCDLRQSSSLHNGNRNSSLGPGLFCRFCAAYRGIFKISMNYEETSR